jgi:hypothetical protein
MEKNANLTDKSLSDYTDKDGKVKRAVYYDAAGDGVADANNKHKLKKPIAINNK